MKTYVVTKKASGYWRPWRLSIQTIDQYRIMAAIQGARLSSCPATWTFIMSFESALDFGVQTVGRIAVCNPGYWTTDEQRLTASSVRDFLKILFWISGLTERSTYDFGPGNGLTILCRGPPRPKMRGPRESPRETMARSETLGTCSHLLPHLFIYFSFLWLMKVAWWRSGGRWRAGSRIAKWIGNQLVYFLRIPRIFRETDLLTLNNTKMTHSG